MEAGADPPAAERGGPRGGHGLVRTLLGLVLKDPGRLPENLAVFSQELLGPGVPGYVSELRRQNPGADTAELERVIARQGVQETSREGGFVGGPFITLIPVAFVAALLTQIKMMLRMAALAGRDPRAPERAAEILVIQGVYPDLEQAAEALEKLPGSRARAAGRHRVPGAAMAEVIWRMAKLLGLVAPAAVSPVSWLIHLGRWVLLFLALAVGMVVPLIWLPYLYMSYYRGTVELTERVSAFYFGPENAVRLPTKYSDVPGLASAVLRAAASLTLTVACVAVFRGLGVRLDGREWPALVLLLVVLSLATSLLWFLRTRHRRRAAADLP